MSGILGPITLARSTELPINLDSLVLADFLVTPGDVYSHVTRFPTLYEVVYALSSIR